MRILIVEDDPLYRRILKLHIEKWGHEAVLAENGLEAWRIFQEERFPIILTDWMMPEMDGPELIGRVREIESEECVFIVLLTSKSDKEDIVDGMESGADDFLTKPVDPDELRVRLKAGQRVIELEHRVAERNAELEKMNRRMQVDLNAAARIQKALLPSEPPEVPNAHFAWSFKPCDELAGDTFNAIRLDENHIGLYLLDVSGHGVAAALLSVTLSRLLSPLSSANSLLKRSADQPPFYQLVPPAEVAAELNRRFPWDPGTRQFFTIVYGILDLRSTEFRYVCAGHPSPVHLTNGSASLAGKSSPAIGFIPGATFTEQNLQLHPGDRIYLYSDGIPEAMNDAVKEYSDERLVETLAQHRDITLDASLSRLEEELTAWHGSGHFEDDVSILAAEIV